MMMLGIALAAGLLAQTASGQATPSADKITVTGCVERADEVTPTGSSLGTTVDSLDFVLMKAREGDGAAATGTTGSSSSSSSSAAAAPGPMYRLDAKVGELNPHVGHKVEIVGTIENGGSGRLENSGANAPKLKVDSIKMIASTCAR